MTDARIKSKALYDLGERLKSAKALICEASHLARGDMGSLPGIGHNTLDHVRLAELALALAIYTAREENSQVMVEHHLKEPA